MQGWKDDTCRKEENLSFNMMYNMFELKQVSRETQEES